ncbi:MAG: HAD-IIIC family phosphatase [Syntrophomonas sp.]
MKYPELIAEVRRREQDKKEYEQNVKLFFLRNYTIDTIEPFIKFRLYESNIKPQLLFGDYDVIAQEVLESSSSLHQFAPDIIALSLWLENMAPDYYSFSWDPKVVVLELIQLFDLIKDRTRGLVVANTFIAPFYSEMGILRSQQLSRIDERIEFINNEIKEYVRRNSNRFYLVDWERLVKTLGEEFSMDYRYWYSSRAPFKPAFLDLYAKEIVILARALKGRAKKCVVLDADNTLWGGIVGEDGIEGIALDNYKYPGKSFYDFQKTLLFLYERGVMLAICSKNNENDVWEVLDKHPHCLIKREHIAAWRINWEDKASNIQSIVHEINIGIDSIVFIDDSSVECELVRSFFPDITVLQVPDKLYLYPPLLLKEGYFDTLTISQEDKLRTEMYRAEAQRNNEKQRFENINDYLSSLQLEANIHPVRNNEITRVAQLTQKTNQFNLTTRRYSEKDIEEMANQPDSCVFSLSVKDKFGDYGLTGVLIVKREENTAFIDSLLLSCRILGRKLEDVFVQYCIKTVERRWGVSSWHAEYVPSQKNQQVAGFWDRTGFILKADDEGKKQYYFENENNESFREEINFIRILED